MKTHYLKLWIYYRVNNIELYAIVQKCKTNRNTKIKYNDIMELLRYTTIIILHLSCIRKLKKNEL